MAKGVIWEDGNKKIVDVEIEPRSELSVRQERDALLSSRDWTQIADAPVDQAAWAAYRQALRDVPAQSGFPDNVTWPDKP